MSRSVSRIKDVIEQSGPSVIITSSPSPFFAFEVLRASKKLRVPLIFDVRDVWPYHVIASGGRITNTIKKHIERKCARGANLVFAVTDGVKQTLVKDHNLTPERVVVVPNGADLELFRPLSSEKKWDVVILGAASKYRNLENAYQAFALLFKRRPATKILHLGWQRGSYTIGLEKLAERLRLFPALELRPPVPLEQVPAILSAGRVGFVSQTFDAPIRAALAVKSFEYIAAGLPIACLGPPEDCELSKLVRETGAGIYASTPEELALEIQKLLDDSDRLEKLSTAAVHAAILFDRGAIVRRAYDQYFMPLMKGRGG